MSPSQPPHRCNEPGCGVLTKRRYCNEHELEQEQRRGSPSDRGYDAQYQRDRAAAIEAEPWCHNPDGCPHDDADTDVNPLTTHHGEALGRGGDRRQPLVVWCKRCNSSRGART